MLRKIGRILAVLLSVLVILLSVGGILGAWWVNGIVSDVTLKVFAVIQGGVQVVDTAAARVDGLVQTARGEVQQAGETVTTIGANLQENNPVLTALSERVESRLGPGVDNIREALSPVHDALVRVGNAVSFANSLPFVQERVPQLEQIDQTFTRLGTLGADIQQLRSTLRAMTEARADNLTEAAATALTDLTSRIDAGLAEIQSSLQTLQSDITALQARLQQRQSQLLLIYNLSALAMTLLFFWVIYSQVVVIRYHGRRARRAAETVPAPAVAMPAAAPVAAPAATTAAAPAAAPASVSPDVPTAAPINAATDTPSTGPTATGTDSAETVTPPAV